MQAIIKAGGKQYCVTSGEKLKIEYLKNAKVGQKLILDEILYLKEEEQIKIGSPFIPNKTISATILSHGKHKKINIFKMRRRKHYQKHQGHRQSYTEIQINAID